MKAYYPDSWSEQARRLANREVESVEAGWQTIKGAYEFFSRSYRHPLIRGRAAKRFGRLVRAGKVKEDLEEYYRHFPEDKAKA